MSEPVRTYPSVLAQIEGAGMYLVALDRDWGRILNRAEHNYYPTGLIGTHLVMTGPWEFLDEGAISAETFAGWIAQAHDVEADLAPEQRAALAARIAAWRTTRP